jgi:non-heme chloroperoxidase
MLKTENNPGGLPIAVFDNIRAGVAADRSQFYKEITLPFYGYNRPGAKVSEGIREHWWLQGMLGGIKAPHSPSFTDLPCNAIPTNDAIMIAR